MSDNPRNLPLANLLVANLLVAESPGTKSLGTDTLEAKPLVASDIVGFATQENFPVALRVLRKPLRQDLLALYGFARFVDNLGDDPIDASGSPRSREDRLVDLDAAEYELDRAADGTATNDIFIRLGETMRRCQLGREDFVKLIDANRLDQIKSRYETWDDLMGYCELSANPVGKIVLAIFEADAKQKARQNTRQNTRQNIVSPDNIALSDKICSALQVAEHLQDIGEDFRAGRIYLPQDHCERFGCSEDDIAMSVERSITAYCLRKLVLFEAKQARQILNAGTPLIAKLRGGQRLAMIGFVAGGHAALDAVEAAGGEVLTEQCVATKSRQASRALRLLI